MAEIVRRTYGTSHGVLAPESDGDRHGIPREYRPPAGDGYPQSEGIQRMRVLGVDFGDRRVGLAISDVTQTLARPFVTLTALGPDDAVEQVVSIVERLIREEDGLTLVVVGKPMNLDGSASPQTARVASFMASLVTRLPIPVVGLDERLTSREAESRLALRERDWRRRKKRLDAAAAAIILQDYLDHRPGSKK